MVLRDQGLSQPHSALCALLNFSISRHSYAPGRKAENMFTKLEKTKFLGTTGECMTQDEFNCRGFLEPWISISSRADKCTSITSLVPFEVRLS